jgi:hypothetical protein
VKNLNVIIDLTIEESFGSLRASVVSISAGYPS